MRHQKKLLINERSGNPLAVEILPLPETVQKQEKGKLKNNDKNDCEMKGYNLQKRKSETEEQTIARRSADAMRKSVKR